MASATMARLVVLALASRTTLCQPSVGSGTNAFLVDHDSPTLLVDHDSVSEQLAKKSDPDPYNNNVDPDPDDTKAGAEWDWGHGLTPDTDPFAAGADNRGEITTSMTTPIAPGDSSLDVASTAGFLVGDEIVIDKGLPNEETHTITALSSINTKGAMKNAHTAGASVKLKVIQHGQCPGMVSLGRFSHTHLQVVPWAWFRTVNIWQPTTIMSDAGGGKSMVASSAAHLLTVQGSSDSKLLEDTAARSYIGQVRSTWGWTYTMALFSPHNGREISKIVNPGSFWDTTQDIYDCNDQLLGKIRSKFSWAGLFSNRYNKHKVENPQGNHIADLLHETQTESYYGSGQHFIYIADITGQPLASMRRPSGGWQVGPFGEYFACEIQMESLDTQVSPPAMDPQFLSLVMAEALAGQHLLGPFIGFILWPIFICILLACCLGCGMLKTLMYWLTCCGLFDVVEAKSSEYERGWEDKSNNEPFGTHSEEKNSLIASPVKTQERGLLGCCSRRQPTIVAPNDQPTSMMSTKANGGH